MLIQFTPSGGILPATLADDANKFAAVIEQLGGNSIAQVEPLAGGLNPALFARGNVGGDLVFRSSKTYADYQTTFAQFKTEYARLNQKGTLMLTEGVQTLTFANAVLKGLQRMFDGSSSGTRMGIRYTFTITTIT
jgi:hypothetical protein